MSEKRTIALGQLKERIRKAFDDRDEAAIAECLDNMPGLPSRAVCYFRDGDLMCCVFADFRNLQDDYAGFGESEAEAYADLRRQTTCEACDGSGRVPEKASWSVDAGTKWQRSFEQEVTVECDQCNGVGISMENQVQGG